MGRQVLEYRHPTIYVKVGDNTYQFAVRDNRTIEEPALGFDDRDAAHAAAIAYLRGYHRWFGHWIPVDRTAIVLKK